ncbi:MAG: hypothetical protein GKR89_10150 [Candidatus Latescibacteria bacterium]|nr:hypothetical protein [Candidatus Latescibacterota bacterium]
MSGRFWPLLVASILALACSEKEQVQDDPNPLVARIGEVEIRRGELQAAMQRIPEQKRPGAPALLQALVDRHIIQLEAGRRGLQTSPRLQSRLRRDRLEQARERLLAQQVEARIEVSDAEISSYFEEQQLGAKRHVRGRHIMVRDQATADSLYKELVGGADFAELARRHSIEQQTAGKGGDLGFWDETLMIGAVAAQLFALPMGQMSPPFPGKGDYFHIVRAEDERPITYDDMAQRLRQRFVESRRHDRMGVYYEELRRQYELQVEAESLLYLIELARTAIHGLPQLKAGVDRARVLARYKGGQIDLEQYLGWIAAQAPNKRPVATDTASIRVFAQRMAIDSLFIPLEGRLGGLEDDEQMKAYIEARQELLMAEELRWIAAEEPLVGEAALQAYYEENMDRFAEPDLVLYEALLLHTEEEGRNVAQEMHQGADMWRLAQGYPRFHDLLRHYGVFHAEATASHSASPDDPQAQVMEAIRQAPIGAVGGPHRVSIKRPKGEVWWGYLVFRTLERVPAHTQPLSDPNVRALVGKLVRAGQGAAMEARFEAYMRQLRETYADQIETYPERLAEGA